MAVAVPSGPGGAGKYSFTSRCVGWFAGHTLRPMGALLPANALGVGVARSAAHIALPILAPAVNARVHQVHARWSDRTIHGEWVRASTGRHPGAVVLYLHGSGYVACSPRTHRGLVARLSEQSGMPAFALRYRLAPRYPFPAAADDALAAYQWLLSLGYSPGRIVIAGDSAGGHLAIGLCITLRRMGIPLPAGLALFSPLADPTFETAAARDALHHDPYIAAKLAKRMLALCTGTGWDSDPRFSPLHSDLAGLPPTLIQAGGSEALAADAEALGERINAAGGHAQLEIWAGQMHVFQILYRLVPEARTALRRAADFLSAQVKDREYFRRL
ncbi:MAG: alpha/beta hydrolase [Sciscionella sp.]